MGPSSTGCGAAAWRTTRNVETQDAGRKPGGRAEALPHRLGWVLVWVGVLAASALAQTAPWTVIGWRVGIQAAGDPKATLFEAIDRASAAGAKFIEGDSRQGLGAADVAAIRQKMKAAGIQMTTYYAASLPEGDGAKSMFALARSLGAETVVADPPATQWADLDKVASEAGVNLALHNNPRASGIEALSKRVGICADLDVWSKAKISPAEGLQLAKGRLMCVRLHDPQGQAEFFRELNKQDFKAIDLTITGPGDVKPQVAALDSAIIVALGDRMDVSSKTTATRFNVPADAKARIEAAVPKTAPATPRKPRKLLIVDLQAAYGGHGSLPYSNTAFQAMAKQTGAFEAVFSNDLANLRYDKLKQYDALFLNNTVGPILNAQEVRDGIVRYVKEGGGLIGYHGTGRASLDWTEFPNILGAYSGPHTVSTEKVVITVEDTKSALTQSFPEKTFEWTDEFFRFPSPPYSRDNLHVLITMKPTTVYDCAGCIRPDGDYAVSWIHHYGKGRVFYTVLGHTAADFWNPPILGHFLAGIQYALGDLDADATPSGAKK